MGKDADALFVEIALEKGMLTRGQVDACRGDQVRLSEIGYSRTIAQITREKNLLTVRQVTEIRREMAKRGVLPKLGGYELIGKLGEGGMGTVYKARQVSLDRIVALKVLPSELSRNRTYVERFRREGLLAARVSHRNAVQIFDVGEDAGRHYMAMEFVDGSDVKAEINRGPMDERRALEVVRGVAEALAAAHDQGIVHRDIKPANVMLTSKGVPKLSDLGIAKQTGTQGATLTRTGAVIGTPHYMSPEQCLGQKDIDARADIYSLGATLFHMVCGRMAFEANTAMAVMRKQVDDPLPNPKALNPRLSEGTVALIRRLMEKDRNARVQTCAELVSAVDALLSGRAAVGVPETQEAVAAVPYAGVAPTQAPPKTTRQRRWRSLLANPAILAPVIAGAAVLGLGLFMVLYHAGGSDGREEKRYDARGSDGRDERRSSGSARKGAAAGFLPVFGRARSEAAKVACKSKLHQIGKACLLYQSDYGDFYPYHQAGPLHSLALLYPRYIGDPKTFVCSAIRDRETRRFPTGSNLAGYSCSYGYDHLMHFRDVGPGQAIAADMPGNHADGYNVLYFDGHVAWCKTPYGSANPFDNIFAAQPGWQADTDAYIRQ